jgi:hypothetical protein
MGRAFGARAMVIDSYLIVKPQQLYQRTARSAEALDPVERQQYDEQG